MTNDVADRRSVPSTGRFRPELQGLRAFAILLVVIYHVWVGRVSGGVDTFLLISTFLLTLSMVRRIERGQTIRLMAYWAHVFKRLLPAAALTICLILGTGFLLVPANGWNSLWGDAWASLFYVENWRLISESVDYYAAERSGASPYQHFWSLSIQGQVFILWPVIFTAAMLVGRRHGPTAAWRLLLVVFGVILVCSLAWAIVSVQTQQEVAYFDTTARLWEFALGSLLALLLHERQLPRRLGVVAGWVGLIGLATCGVVLDVQGVFPGVATLWPLASAALVISAGDTGSRWGADRLLGHRLAVRAGDLSYGLYLVHWPILVYWSVMTGRDSPGPYSGTAIILLSFLLAWLLTHLVDRPVRNWKWADASAHRSLVVIAASITVVALPLGGWQGAVHLRARQAMLSVSADNPGGTALIPGFEFSGDPEAPVIPDPTLLNMEWVGGVGACSGDDVPVSATLDGMCGYARISDSASREVLVIGNSHAQQYLGVIIPIAENHDWNVRTVLSPGCVLGDAPYEDWNEEFNCISVVEGMIDYAEQVRPDVVMTVGSFVFWDETPDALPAGFEAIVQQLLDDGIDVVAFRDNPRFPTAPPTCVLTHGHDSEECRIPRETTYAVDSPFDPLLDLDRFYAVDLADQFCPDGYCLPQIGNVLVYLDTHHVTRTYMETLEFFVEEQLTEQGFTF